MIEKKKITVPIIIFTIASIIMIILAIFFKVNQLTNKPPTSPATSFDKASQEEITTFTGFSSGEYGNIIFTNIHYLNENGMPKKAMDDFRSMIANHSKQNNNYIKRVSVYKNGYRTISKPNETLTKIIKISINNEEKDMFVKEIYKGYENFELYLYADEELSTELANIKFCSVMVCRPQIKENNNINDNYDG